MNEMEETDNTGEDIPHIPIKTYQWEDVRRSRTKGGYPWTHLTKPPFEEEVDAEMFTMDAYRRSRSSSTVDKSDPHEISEEPLPQIILEDIPEKEKPTDDKINQSIEITEIVDEPVEQELTENKDNLLSVSSSQSIPHSLEEPSKKRKLSVESSHSRISLSKLAIKDKLKNAKQKLKIPKIIKRSKSDVQETKKPKIQKKVTKKLSHYQGASEPVYIHIPLKPPPGETDEYSKYEFESPEISHSSSLTNLRHFGSGKRKMSLLGLLTELKKIYDEQVLASESRLQPPSDETTSTSKKPPRSHTHSNRSLSEKLKIEEMSDEHKTTKSVEEIKELLGASPDAYSSSNLSQYLDKDDKYEIITTEVPNLDIDCVIITDFDESPVDGPTNSNINEFPEWTRLNPDKDARSQLRAKSEEPKRKRKSSIDSSYSRKSLSKLTIMNKLRDAKDSVKLPKFLSFTKSDKSPNEEKQPKVQKKPEAKKTERKPDSPLYIHIPLKVPKEHKEIDGEKEIGDTPECETPISPVETESNVQLIFLTPPSDDEILEANIPETPVESDQKFFDSLKVDELKCIAKKAVDFIYPDKKRLDVVAEGEKNEEEAHNGVQTEGGTTYWQMHPVLVDAEDGLKLSDAAIAMINEEMAKELEESGKPELMSQIRKKVSFKKARAQDGERIYEDVGLLCEPTAGRKTAPLETFRSMSADEEKSYLDDKVIKTTSLEEDYNKWSKITDHEYEPVNPPPEDMNFLQSIDVQASPVLKPSNEQVKHITFDKAIPSDIASENLAEPPSAQNLQDQIEDRYFNASKTPPPQTIEATNRQSQSLEKDKPSRKRSTGTNINEAIRTQADKIKTKLQSIKKPHINLPQPPKFSAATFPKMKFKKPHFTAPKMPDMPSIKLASFSLTRKDNSKNSWRKRQYSTESNAGDSKTKKFDFGTYPGIFNKSKMEKNRSLDESSDRSIEAPTFATVPRVGRAKNPKVFVPEDHEPPEFYYDKTRGFVTIPIGLDNDNTLHRPSHTDNGVTDEDTEIPINANAAFEEWKEDNKNRLSADINGDANELQSGSSASLSEHRQGVLEEIDSDQFFLREKGISQDDIDVGKYLSSEIKEAFRNPKSALTQLQSEDREYDLNVSDQSQSSEDMPKKKWLKKPKRKRTPHVSNEQLSFEFGSDHEDYVEKPKAARAPPPTRPKRRSKKSKKKKPEVEDVIPYQETIPFEEPFAERFDFIDDTELRFEEPAEYAESSETYKNDPDMEVEEPNVILPFYANTQNDELQTHPMYMNTGNEEFEIQPPLYMNTELEVEIQHPMYMNTWQNLEAPMKPVRPIRKNKNLKSLNTIEIDLSIHKDSSPEESINLIKENGIDEELHVQTTPPTKPVRKHFRTRSESVTSLPGQDMAEDMPLSKPDRSRSRTRSESTPSLQDNEIPFEPPTRPNRTRSRARSVSTESFKRSRDLDSSLNVSEQIPCIEEPCVSILCDHMGYAVVDKSKIRDPPLPPSRLPKTPPRKRRKRPATDKFATVPRPPERPFRNYSTLSKPTNKVNNIFDDDKENVNINPYLTIDEDELARRLQSGEVIQKMRERPLPAPPRPPRKTRTPVREVFKDISHEQNLFSNDDTWMDSKQLSDEQLFDMEQQILTEDHEETVTHGALIVQPIGKFNALSHSEFFDVQSNPDIVERIIPIEQEPILANHDEQSEDLVNEELVFKEQLEPLAVAIKADSAEEELIHEDSDEDMSEIPDEFYRFGQPETKVPELERYKEENNQLKLQLFDTDDNLADNDLTPNEFETKDLENVGTNVSDNIVINNVLDDLQQESRDTDENRRVDEIDIALEQLDKHVSSFDETNPPPVPPRSDSVSDLVDVITTDDFPFKQDEVVDLPGEAEPQLLDNILVSKDTLHTTQINVLNCPPIRPPRRSSQIERQRDLHLVGGERQQVSNTNIIEDNEKNGSNVSQNNTLQESNASNLHQTSSPLLSHERMGSNSLPDIGLSTITHRETQNAPSHSSLSFHNMVPTLSSDYDANNIPLAQCSKCSRIFNTLSRSISSEELAKPRRQRRLSEPTIPQLTGQLVQSCGVELDRSFRNLLTFLTDNAEGKQDLQIMLLMLVILIASLILSSGDGKVEHHHHWEYFNPPREF